MMCLKSKLNVYNMSDRQYFINIHSIIHNQLSVPKFKNLIKNGLIQAQIIKETVGQIEEPNRGEKLLLFYCY